MLLANALVAFLIAVQFALLRADAGLAMAGATCVASFLSAVFGERITVWWRVSIGALSLGLLFVLAPSSAFEPVSLFPLLAFLNGRAAELFVDQRRVRWALFPSHALWFIYGLFTLAWGTVALEIVTAASSLFWLMRHRPLKAGVFKSK